MSQPIPVPHALPDPVAPGTHAHERIRRRVLFGEWPLGAALLGLETPWRREVASCIFARPEPHSPRGNHRSGSSSPPGRPNPGIAEQIREGRSPGKPPPRWPHGGGPSESESRSPPGFQTRRGRRSARFDDEERSPAAAPRIASERVRLLGEGSSRRARRRAAPGPGRYRLTRRGSGIGSLSSSASSLPNCKSVGSCRSRLRRVLAESESGRSS